MVSTSYPENAEDWRGRFIANLAAALARQEKTELSLWAPPGELPLGVGYAASLSDAAWLKNLSQQGGIAHLLRTQKWRTAGAVAGLLWRLARVYRLQNPDIIHVNWLQNALPLWGTKNPIRYQRARQRLRPATPARHENVAACRFQAKARYPRPQCRMDAPGTGKCFRRPRRDPAHLFRRG